MLLLPGLLRGNEAAAARPAQAKKPAHILRIGHFPNITHAQALVAQAMEREGRPWFEPRLGSDVTLSWFIYNSGPSAMEAILADSIDLSYSGLTPALNAFFRMRGRDIRILSGACSGGAALVVQGSANVQSASDLRGKQIGTPQLGNTQDIAARAWLSASGLSIRLTGGDALVIPSSNPDLFTLYKRKELDAVWTVEPWVSRLVGEAGGRILFEESTLWPENKGRYATALVVCGTRFKDRHPDIVKRFIAAHVDLTDWIVANPEEAQKLANSQIKEATRRALPEPLLKSAWKRLEFTPDPIQKSVVRTATDMQKLGFTRTIPNLGPLFELSALNDALKERNRPSISP